MESVTPADWFTALFLGSVVSALVILIVAHARNW